MSSGKMLCFCCFVVISLTLLILIEKMVCLSGLSNNIIVECLLCMYILLLCLAAQLWCALFGVA